MSEDKNMVTVFLGCRLSAKDFQKIKITIRRESTYSHKTLNVSFGAHVVREKETYWFLPDSSFEKQSNDDSKRQENVYGMFYKSITVSLAKQENGWKPAN